VTVQTHPIDLQDARQHAALLRIAAQCRIPWTVAIAHAWVSPDGETVGVTLKTGDYAQAVRMPAKDCRP